MSQDPIITGIVGTDGKNQKITKAELAFIRSLEDFDLKMLISEIHDHGWINAMYPTIGGKALIPMMRDAIVKRGPTKPG